ncbi:unnamed protein product [Protopolystoma xenopodis]|uniref:Uncharacterized protein n=1 Tax=Protopolystoma xenopodis TaxID=117903 RepID=A0A3S5FGP8_9PLAT|nr:unnamed protein product [Protopolystoma xenopodis]
MSKLEEKIVWKESAKFTVLQRDFSLCHVLGKSVVKVGYLQCGEFEATAQRALMLYFEQEMSHLKMHPLHV